MLLVTERIINTGGPKRREDPPVHGNLSDVPDLYAGDVSQSQFLFVFHESELSLIDDSLKEKLSRARAGDENILDYVQKQEKPGQGWNRTTMKFPPIGEGETQYVHCYLTSRPDNFICVTNIELSELITAPLKEQGNTIGNHCIKRCYDMITDHFTHYIDTIDPDDGATDIHDLTEAITRLKTYWEQFKLENEGNGHFDSRRASASEKKMEITEQRIMSELELQSRRQEQQNRAERNEPAPKLLWYKLLFKWCIKRLKGAFHSTVETAIVVVFISLLGLIGLAKYFNWIP